MLISVGDHKVGVGQVGETFQFGDFPVRKLITALVAPDRSKQNEDQLEARENNFW